MNEYQLLTLLVAIIAIIISAVSLIRTGRIQRQQIRLNILTEELSRKQLDMISKDEMASNKSRVVVDFQPYGSTHQFIMTNTSSVMARNVTYNFIDCPDNPVIDKPTAPLPILQPGQTIKYLAARDFQSPPTYTVEVLWTDPDGSEQKETYILNI